MKVWVSLVSAVTGLMLLSGCASYSGGSLVPGTATQADVRQLMGEPAAVHKGTGAQAIESWEYHAGHLGAKLTWCDSILAAK